MHGMTSLKASYSVMASFIALPIILYLPTIPLVVFLFLLMYVDEILLSGSSFAYLHDYISTLCSQFSVKNFDPFHILLVFKFPQHLMALPFLKLNIPLIV